uniref:Uncharacterized protein n=1 Tax=Ixodes ricinus TaxID=34613 RepID=A0A6B0U7V2_IXORI
MSSVSSLNFTWAVPPPVWSQQLPMMRISCRLRWLEGTFSMGGVLSGLRRWDSTIDDESRSTTFTRLSASMKDLISPRTRDHSS